MFSIRASRLGLVRHRAPALLVGLFAWSASAMGSQLELPDSPLLQLTGEPGRPLAIFASAGPESLLRAVGNGEVDATGVFRSSMIPGLHDSGLRFLAVVGGNDGGHAFLLHPTGGRGLTKSDPDAVLADLLQVGQTLPPTPLGMYVWPGPSGASWRGVDWWGRIRRPRTIIDASGLDNSTESNFYGIDNDGGNAVKWVKLELPGSAFWDLDGTTNYAGMNRPVIGVTSGVTASQVTWVYDSNYPHPQTLKAVFNPPMAAGALLRFACDTDNLVSDPCPGGNFGLGNVAVTLKWHGVGLCGGTFRMVGFNHSEMDCR